MKGEKTSLFFTGRRVDLDHVLGDLLGEERLLHVLAVEQGVREHEVGTLDQGAGGNQLVLDAELPLDQVVELRHGVGPWDHSQNLLHLIYEYRPSPLLAFQLLHEVVLLLQSFGMLYFDSLNEQTRRHILLVRAHIREVKVAVLRLHTLL